MKSFFHTFILIALLSYAARPVSAAVKGRVYTEKGSKELLLLGVSEGQLQYKFGSGGATSVMPLSAIESVRIPVDYDRGAFRKALNARNHGTAAAILVKSLLNSRMFFELPNNNQTLIGMETLTLLMRAAEERLLIGDESARKEAVSQYTVALGFANSLARADWYEDAEEAAFRAVVCLIALGKVDKAEEALEVLSVPPETDTAFGWYALARARLLARRENWEDAVEAGIESVVFQTKDIDSFPLSLLLTAQCYEQLGQWYRARDAYFAIGSLMKTTAWEPYAIQRLQHILDNKLTEAEEKRDIQQIFFSGKEDLNGEARALVDAFIESKQKQQSASGQGK